MTIIINYSPENGDGSHLLWENLAVTDGATITTSASNGFDVDYAFDYLSTTSFRPSGSGTFSISATFQQSRMINAIGLAGVNFAGAGINSVNVRDASNNIIESFDTSSYGNEQPALLVFAPTDTSVAKVEFVISGGSESAVVGNLYIGKTIEFPGQPDVGYQPGKWNNKREVESFKSQTNAFGRSVTVERGTEEIINFSLLPIEFMDAEYKPFVQKHAGWPVFFAWDKVNYPGEVIFGQVTKKGNSAFTTGIHSSVGLTITGNI